MQSPYAAYNIGSGHNNVLVGDSAGYNSGNSYNVFVGSKAGYSNTSGSSNSFLGAFAGYANTTGSGNNFSGMYSGYNNTIGTSNNFFGFSSGYNNTTGTGNTMLGYATGSVNQSGSQNTLVGYQAGTILTGSANTLIGYNTGYNITTGSNNSFFGYQAGRNVTTGSNNIIIGPTSGTAITDGDNNILMGYNSQAEDGVHNATAIGAGSRVAVSNALILGNSVNVGIGTSSPATRLEVVGETTNQSGLRLTQLTAKSQSNYATDEFLTVDERGDVIKARYQLRISDANQWSDKVFTPSYRLLPLKEVSAFVIKAGHLPGIPSSEQVRREGVDLVEINSLLLEKIEELTLYNIEQQKRSDEQQERINKLERMVQGLMQKK